MLYPTFAFFLFARVEDVAHAAWVHALERIEARSKDLGQVIAGDGDVRLLFVLSHQPQLV